MHVNVERLEYMVRVMKLFSHVTRAAIIKQLIEGDLDTHALARGLGVEPSQIHRQLIILRNSGLVEYK